MRQITLEKVETLVHEHAEVCEAYLDCHSELCANRVELLDAVSQLALLRDSHAELLRRHTRLMALLLRAHERRRQMLASMDDASRAAAECALGELGGDLLLQVLDEFERDLADPELVET